MAIAQRTRDSKKKHCDEEDETPLSQVRGPARAAPITQSRRKLGGLFLAGTHSPGRSERVRKYGQGWIRTSEGVSQRIYSPPRLATSVPTRRTRIASV